MAAPPSAPPPVSPGLILASASPRRLDLLRQIGVVPAAVEPAELDETPGRTELPPQLAVRLAEAKARAVAARFPAAVVLAADTVVGAGRRILPKAETEAEARRCLALLSGRRHRVITGVAVAHAGKVRVRAVTTIVRFKRLSALETEGYIATGEWRGKAGGYAIQGHAALLIAVISGSYSNVVGLPLHETGAMLAAAGIPVWPVA
jgi:septum formation protein